MTSSQEKQTGTESLHQIADTVGFVPNVRFRDNLIQGLSVLVFAGIGAGGGYLWMPEVTGVLAGTAAGLAVGTLLSGAVLGVFRWSRSRQRATT